MFKHYFFFQLHRKLRERQIDAFSKVRMLAFCGHPWWMKSEYPEEATDLGRATTTLPYKNAGNWIQVAAVTNKGFTPEWSRSFILVMSYEPHRDKTTKWHVRTAKTHISLGIRLV